MKIEYLNNNNWTIDHLQFYNQLPILTKTIGDSYPKHFKWLEETFLGGLKQNKGNRSYSFAVDFNHLSGCALLKRDAEEKKLCCLFIDPNYRRQGIASRLVENSFLLLDTDKPLMTVSEQNLSQLEGLIKRYNFELTSVKDSIYLPGVKEYYYNEGLSR